MAYIDGGDPVVIQHGRQPNHAVDGRHHGERERLVGQIAKRQAITNPEHTVFASKRLICRKVKSPELRGQIERFPYEVVEADNGDAWVKLRDQAYSLRKLPVSS